MKAKKPVLEKYKIIPIDTVLRPSQVANMIYPDSIGNDSEGRKFNRASATVARVMRRTKGFVEIEDGLFVRMY